MKQRRHPIRFRVLAPALAWLVGAPPMTAWATPIPASSRESEQQQEPLEALRLSGSSGTEQVTVNRRVPDTTPPPALPEFSERPTDQEIFEARVFYEPLVPGSGDVSHSENRALATALVDYSRVGGGEQVQAILDFLEKHPRVALARGSVDERGDGVSGNGLFHASAFGLRDSVGSDEGRDRARARAMADRALAEHAELNARLGRFDVLEPLFGEIEDRNVRGSATEKLSGARQGLWLMINKLQAIRRSDDKQGGTCEVANCQKGLATYRFHSMMISLNITDTPVGYSPPVDRM